MKRDIQETTEYKLILDYYGTKTTKRSNVPLINHIDEGLIILDHISADWSAMKAYCIHPIVQSDIDLRCNYKLISDWGVGAKPILFAMEYRKTANAYLSKRIISSIDEIELSFLDEVNDMLIADKVQNYKDFLLYHKNTHERSVELDQYFNNWFKRLNIDYSLLATLI